MKLRGWKYLRLRQPEHAAKPAILHLPTHAIRRVLRPTELPRVVWRGAWVSLIAASDGNLYGTFSGSSANNTGFIFEATLSGQWQTVANFLAPGTNGMAEPGSLVEASDYALYGATVHNAIFRYDLATHARRRPVRHSRRYRTGYRPCPE
jgi:hypothetical protein